MIRVLLGAAVSIFGLGAAAAHFGPDLFAGPVGEPLIMAARNEASMQTAAFDGEACPSALLFSSSSNEGRTGGHRNARIVAFALRSSDDDVAVAIEDFPGGNGTAKTIVLVFDDEGGLVAAGDPASLQVPFDDEVAQDCPPDIAAPI